MDKEVDQGWALPLTIDLVLYIKDAVIFPLGISKQLSINYNGKRYTKICVIHD